MDKKNTKSSLTALNIAATKAMRVIAQATEEAARTLGTAADKATSTIANAALDAARLLASNAAEAVKVNSAKSSDDHDLLIELKTKMDDLKTDIKELKDGTNDKIADHERRISALQAKTANYTITLVLYSLAVASMIGLIVYHILST